MQFAGPSRALFLDLRQTEHGKQVPHLFLIQINGVPVFHVHLEEIKKIKVT